MIPAKIPGVFFLLAVAAILFIPDKYLDQVALVLTVAYFVVLWCESGVSHDQ